MDTFKNRRVVVTGGSRGLGFAIAQALLARGADITVVARDKTELAKVERIGASTEAGDATDAAFINGVVARLKPVVLILNAGATPHTGSIDEQSWETFCTVWNTDVKAGLYAIQTALRTPLEPGSRVLIASSGAARHGAPLSGSYTGAKQMLWFMAHYANEIANDRGLGIRFQVLVPMQMFGETELAQEILGGYARRQGISIGAVLAARYGKVLLSARDYGEMIATLLSDPRYANGVAYGFGGDTRITLLDG